MAAPAAEEGKMLNEALATVKIHVQQMKRFLEAEQLMDALKSASSMLAELRTSSLSPKQYYELYMVVFDALRHLSNYLYEAHIQEKHHLADLYELVQYAGNIVPRLYLMITVGSVYMSVPDAPVREIMRDMMDMTRGVQHPTRGLFLRHYLSGQTKDHLPIGNEDTPAGNLQDSISFVLTNFIEMNKLWVRLQHQGHSRDRDKREMERRELRILVGTNLVRLSQLDGVELDIYQSKILPSILEQVVNCKDVIAQEYLMEVVIQVFTDEFHLYSLGPFLTATSQLEARVNIKQIVIALIDRLAAYAAREAENEDPEQRKIQEEEAARRLADKVKAAKARAKQNGSTSNMQTPSVATDGWGAMSSPTISTAMETEETLINGSTDEIEKSLGKGKEPQGSVEKFRGIPENVKLFEVFWQQVVRLIKVRPDLVIQDIMALSVSLMNLSLSCYPDRLDYVDQILGFAQSKMAEFANSPDLFAPQTTTLLASLLLAPVNSYQSILTLLALSFYSPLLLIQPFSTRRSIAYAIISSILKSETVIETPEDVSGVLELCQVLIKDQLDMATTGQEPSYAPGQYSKEGRRLPYYSQREELAEEQGWIARMVHLFRSDSLDVQFELFQTARREFEVGGQRIRYTYPALITNSIKLCRRYHQRKELEDDWEKKLSSVMKFTRQLTSILATQVDAPTIALPLFLLAAQVCDECGFEDLTYDLYVQAFTVYEDNISESRAQLQAITLISGALENSKVFSVDNYDTLITKAALHSAKLLKKPHQAVAVHSASHLWWQNPTPGVVADDSAKSKTTDGLDGPKAYPHQDSQRVLECLQKSLRIADSVIEPIITVQLCCDALDHYIYYLEHKATAITPKFVNSLVELILSNIDEISSTNVHPSQRAPPGLLEGVQTPEMIIRHFTNTLRAIQLKKVVASNTGDSRWEAVDIVGALLKMNVGSGSAER